MNRVHIVWFQPYANLLKAKLRRQYKDQWFPEGGVAGVEHRGLLGQRITLYDTKMMDMCHDTFVQIHGIYHPIVNRNVNQGLWWLWCVNLALSLISFLNMPFLWLVLILGGGYTFVGSVDTWEISVSSLNFTLNLKLLKKHKVLTKS